MNNIIGQFAVTASGEKPDLLTSIGVDWKLLAFQTIAFLILLAILRKWVYPPLSAMLNKREAELKASADAAIKAERHAAEAEAKAAKILKKAWTESREIVATAREEAADVVEEAHQKATGKAEALVSQARDEISKEVETAKRALQNETLDLVAEASGKILHEKVDTKKDAALISRVVKEAQ